MKVDFRFKVTSKHLRYALIGLACLLIGMGALGILGYPVPDKVASEISNGVIFCALIVFLYNRKIRTDEAKALAAEKEKEKPADEPVAEPAPEVLR
ncbi:MAG: hypothetical protein WCL50_14245 [Spirochaetota bacterium]